MTLAIELNADPLLGVTPSKADFAQWIDATFTSLNYQKSTEISLSVISSAEIQTLNHTYRNKNKPTNVLSFPAELASFMQSELLGDIVFCHEIIETEARAQNKSVQAHWAHMTIHGTLHLLGYDHIEEDEAQAMESLEINILESLHFKNPYQQLN